MLCVEYQTAHEPLETTYLKVFFYVGKSIESTLFLQVLCLNLVAGPVSY